jgi:hypothetical protein
MSFVEGENSRIINEPPQPKRGGREKERRKKEKKGQVCTGGTPLLSRVKQV